MAHAWSLAPPAAIRRLNPDVVALRRAAIIGPAARVVAARGLRPAPEQSASVESPQARTANVAFTEISEVPLPARIRAALRSDGFELYAQSLERVRGTSAVPRYEVLVRMREGKALHLPAVFFDAAAEHGFLPDIDRWVIGRLLQRLQADDSGCEFSVNVSAASVREAFGDFIETQLQRTGVAPKRLIFEFAERTVLEHPEAFATLAQRVHALGCRVALDDCRQGFDVSRLVQRHPIQCLKIDGVITRPIDSDARALKLVREIAEVASDIGIETVAETIEDASTLCRLRELPVDFAQGFHIARPIPLADVRA